MDNDKSDFDRIAELEKRIEELKQKRDEERKKLEEVTLFEARRLLEESSTRQVPPPLAKAIPDRHKVETLSREEINAALDTIKKMRNEQGYSGGIPHGEEIMCYSRPQPTYFEWDKVPSKHTCLTCGKVFGGISRNNAIRDWNIPKDKFYVDANSLDRIFDIPKSITDLGYEAKIDFNCLECVVGTADCRPQPPFVISAKVDSESDYTVSYFREQYAVSKEYYPEGFDYFYKKDYNQAIGFLRTLKNKSVQAKLVFELEKQSDGLYKIHPSEFERLKREWGADFEPCDFLKEIAFKREKEGMLKKTEEKAVRDFIRGGGAYEKAEIVWGKADYSDKLKYLSFFTNLKENFAVSFYVDFDNASLQSAARIWNDGKSWPVVTNILKGILGIDTGGEL